MEREGGEGTQKRSQVSGSGIEPRTVYAALTLPLHHAGDPYSNLLNVTAQRPGISETVTPGTLTKFLLEEKQVERLLLKSSVSSNHGTTV